MGYTVGELIEGKPLPVAITKGESVATALSIMVHNDFSQLPVIKQEGEDREEVLVEGMVTYESIIRAIRHFGWTIDRLQVRHAMVNAPVCHEDDDLFDILDRLKATNVVFVLDAVDYLSGIVTSYDTAEYFRSRTEDMMWVEDIEEMIKEFIKQYHADENGDLSEQKDDELIQKNLPYYLKENGYKGKKKTFKDLTLNDFMIILTAKDTWSFYEPIFCMDRIHVIDLLNGVRDIRNDVAHFRGEVSIEARDKLKFVAAWLNCCQAEYTQKKEEEQNKKNLEWHDLPEPIQKEVEEAIEPIILESEAQFEISNYSIMETDVSGGRYGPLADWLQNQPAKVKIVRLPFEKIEEIIGGELPASARNHRAWWANDPIEHSQSIAWLNAGWRVYSVYLNEHSVSFSRTLEREKTEFDFIRRLVEELRERADFPVLNVSFDGTDLLTVQFIPQFAPNAGFFAYRFNRGENLCVELRLNLGNQKLTKAVFDRLYTKRKHFEALVSNIKWARLDAKMYSNLAIYLNGDITETEKHDELSKWAVDTMIQFYHALAEPAEQIINEVRGG